MAEECKAKGCGNQLGPTDEPLGRTVFRGRLFEDYGSDPYLNGKLFSVAVNAVQSQDVIAIEKRFLGCQNNHTLNGLLKTELGFPGYVVPDFSVVTNNTRRDAGW
ncbi:hypothetical protein B0A49_04200 [Cryomyces minteri]|uniref:beta-glucosidase n=1 Tax=Cryomyces minteri TaxID=331657 RepID=A0A4U0XMS1_9PEZI|nr:hypothetical protein B0A49_04200 [Cryomyces minteri]